MCAPTGFYFLTYKIQSPLRRRRHYHYVDHATRATIALTCVVVCPRRLELMDREIESRWRIHRVVAFQKNSKKSYLDVLI
jgi:hypothetical protein